MESITGLTTYSMAYGGYGPAHSLILWDEAAALNPTFIIEAFYAGNDLYDSFDVVYNLGQLPELKTDDPGVQTSVRSREESDPIGQRVSRSSCTPEEGRGAEISSLRKFVGQHSKIYALLRRARSELKRSPAVPEDSRNAWETAKRLAQARRGHCQVLDHGRAKTILTPDYRLAALDTTDPRIAEGLHISLRAVKRMNELAVARGIRFLVVTIPTKEFVFRPVIRDASASYWALIEHEERFRNTAISFFESNGIEYVDTLLALREQISRGDQPYQATQDGHPNGFGHRAIALLLGSRIKRQGNVNSP